MSDEQARYLEQERAKQILMRREDAVATVAATAMVETMPLLREQVARYDRILSDPGVVL